MAFDDDNDGDEKNWLVVVVMKLLRLELLTNSNTVADKEEGKEKR
jgi:hypothetical protein